MKNLRILCVGHCVLDRIFEINEMPRAAHKITARTSRESGGGPASTAAIAIAKMGGHVEFIGYLGTDDAGQTLKNKLTQAGVITDRLIYPDGYQTITPVVLVDPTGERCIIVHRRQASIKPEQIHIDLNNIDTVLVDTRWILGATCAIDAALERGKTTVIDVDGGDKNVILPLIKNADHVIFSEQGLTECTSASSLDDRLREAQRFSKGFIAVTVGSNGSYWLINDEIHHVPSFKIKAIDTTGCGDVFHGAYALAITEGLAPLDAAHFASAAAALKAQNGNGWDGMPSRAEVMKFFKPRSL